MATRTAHIRVPLAQSLQLLTRVKVQDGLQSQGRRLPCTVSQVMSSGIVEVNFEVNAGIFTPPKMTVPVHGFEYIRYPIQKGDKGYCQAAQTRLGNMTGLGSGVPDLSVPGNLQGLVFCPLGNKEWTDAIDPNAVEIYGVGTSGVILRSGDSLTIVTIESAGITAETGTEVEFDAPQVTADQNLSVGNGASGTFSTGTGQVITVLAGIIVDISP